MPYRAALLCLLFACLATPALAQQQAQVTIYRCADAKGNLTFQDAPCRKDQVQTTREMVRPKDPPPRPVPTSRITSAPAPEPPRVIVLRTPQPLYECVRPDNSVYTSDNGDGNPRYVLYAEADDGRWSWPRGSGRDYGTHDTPGFTPVTPPLVGISQGPANDRPGFTPISPPLVGIPQGTRHVTLPPRPTGPPPPPGYGYGYGYGSASVLIRDQCHPLPQAETCARLRDRRDDIRDRFFNAQQTERAQLNKEERSINARLAADCEGG